MLSRRGFVSAGMAAAAVTQGLGLGGQAAAQDRYDQDELLQFYPLGQVTLMHASDLRGQILPHFYRPAESHVVRQAEADQPENLSGEALRIRYGIGGLQPQDMAFTHENFVDLAMAYGKMGGLAHLMTLVRGIRSLRPGAQLLLGGDSAVGLRDGLGSKSADLQRLWEVLSPDAVSLGGEQLLGDAGLAEFMRGLTCPIVGPPNRYAEKAGMGGRITPFAMLTQNNVKIAVLGQDDPFVGSAHRTPALEPQFFKDRFVRLQSAVLIARNQGASVVVCLSQNGWDADRAMAEAIKGIDVILSGRSHIALPEPVQVGQTHVVASGGQGRFLSRLDLEVEEGAIKELRHKLIPVFSDLIDADPEMVDVVRIAKTSEGGARGEELGRARHLLFARGALQTSWDDLICDAMMHAGQADIAFLPARRWGTSVLPGNAIRREDVLANTALPGDVRVSAEPTWAIKATLEEAADAVFHADPLLRSQLDMIRTGGLRFRLDPERPKGRRITELALLESGGPLQAYDNFRVVRTGAAFGTGLGTLQDVVEQFIGQQGTVGRPVSDNVQLGAAG